MGLQEDLVGGPSGESGGWVFRGIWWVGLQGDLVGEFFRRYLWVGLLQGTSRGGLSGYVGRSSREGPRG